MYKDLRTFTGGMDTDSDPRNIQPEDYTTATNLLSGVSKVGGVKNFLGNTLIPYTLPSGNNTCIGSLRNIKENSIIYFVYNDIGNHSILEYYCETKTILPILAPFSITGLTFTTDFLGFTLENKIHSANIIDDLLFWVDNNVSPRQINKKSARAFMNQTPPSADVFPYNNIIATSSVPAQKLQFIEAIKYKPQTQPLIELGFDPTRKTNYIKELMIQVKYRYIYLDNERSRWSDGSYVSLPENDENVNGVFYNSTANNFLRVFYNLGHPNVKAVELAFRFGNTEAWARLDTPIYKYDKDNQRIPGMDDYYVKTYDFYNDSVLIVELDEFDNYDSVPLISKTQEIIDGNRIVYSNNVEGYENPDLNASVGYFNDLISFDPEVSAINAIPSSATDDFYYYVYSSGVLQEAGVLFIPNAKPSYLKAGATISFTVSVFDGSGYGLIYPFAYTLTEESLASYPTTLASEMRLALMDLLGTRAISLEPTLAAGYLGLAVGRLAPPPFYTRISDVKIIPSTDKLISWKKGAWHPFGIVYKDIQGRDGGVLTGPSMNLYNPYFPEIFPLQSLDNNLAYKTQARITINHQPPEWAYKYEIVYATNDLLKYTQFLLRGNPTRTSQGNYQLDCKYIVDYITKQRVVTSVDFQFETGDKLRFIANADNYVSVYVEAKVLAFDTTTNLLTVTPYSESQITAGMGTATQEGTLVELYQKKILTADTNRPFFAIGETYDVLNPGTANRAHAGNISNQNPSAGNPAQLSLNRGDCYIYRRYFNNNTLDAVVESENFSDYYQSKNIDISSVYVVIPNNKTRRYSEGIRYGGRYFPNTQTNNICQFNGVDNDILNARYGPVNKLQTIGYTLKVLQTKKVTSIYIDRNMIFNADGEGQLTLTDKVLGNKNPSEDDYGCDHPESVIVDDRQMYFFDVNTGTYIQDSANGMYPVSDYRAKTYFRNIANAIKNKTGIYVYGGVDNANELINVTFVDTNTTPSIENQTIVYHPSQNRWKTMASYIPEYFGSNALVMVMFKNGQLWEANTNELRNNFFGVQFATDVTFVSNIDFPKVKVFNAIAVYSNKTWASPTIGDIQIPSSINYPQGMSSRLLEDRFRWKEGVSYSEYSRDALSPNFASAQLALINGRKLRGESLLQRIENTSTDEVVLYSVIVHSAPSELSK